MKIIRSKNYINFTVAFLIIFFVFFGCRFFSPSSSGEIPVVEIVEPGDGDTIRTASLLIKVNATPEDEIMKVRFFDNNLFIGEARISPYKLLWETAFVSNGEHILYAEAVNKSGNTGKSPAISVSVTKDELYDWNPVHSLTPNRLNGIFTCDSSHIWCCGDNGSMMFYNGSEWSSQTVTNNSLSALFFLSQEQGWCVGNNVILEFNNQVWNPLFTINKENFRSIFLFSDTLGWVGNHQGKIYAFYGDSLVEYGLLSALPITDIIGFMPSDVWASSGNEIFHYDGNEWSLDTTLVGEYINKLFSIGSSELWAAGTHLFSYNGGIWEMKQLPSSVGTSYEINGIYFQSQTNGALCGLKSEGGFIALYDGVVWKEESIPDDVLLNSITILSSGEGWAVGNSGVILHRKAAQ